MAAYSQYICKQILLTADSHFAFCPASRQISAASISSSISLQANNGSNTNLARILRNGSSRGVYEEIRGHVMLTVKYLNLVMRQKNFMDFLLIPKLKRKWNSSADRLLRLKIHIGQGHG